MPRPIRHPARALTAFQAPCPETCPRIVVRGPATCMEPSQSSWTGRNARRRVSSTGASSTAGGTADPYEYEPAVRESVGLLSMSSRGRLNSPPPHTSATTFERRRAEQLRFHAGRRAPTTHQARGTARMRLNESAGVESTIAAERDVARHSAAHDTHLRSMGASSLAADTAHSRAWTGETAARGEGVASPGDHVASSTAARASYGHRGRGPRYAHEMLAGTGAARPAGVGASFALAYGDEAASHVKEAARSSVADAASHCGRGPRYHRETLAGTGAALSAGVAAGVASFYGQRPADAKEEAGTRHGPGRGSRYSRGMLAGDGAATVLGAGDGHAAGRGVPQSRPGRQEHKRDMHAERELSGLSAAEELPGPRSSGAAVPGGRPAMRNRRDFFVRDTEPGPPRSHWESESASMQSGHRTGWRDPRQALPSQLSGKGLSRAHQDRCHRSTALW